MYGRQSDNESIYWTKSLNQENVRIDLEGKTLGSGKSHQALIVCALSGQEELLLITCRPVGVMCGFSSDIPLIRTDELTI